MKTLVLAVGRLKDAPYREIEAHYVKLLGRYSPIEVIETKDEKLPARSARQEEKKKILEAEGEKLLERVPSGAHLVALDVTGKSRSSEQMAHWLSQKLEAGRPLAFAIGGPFGLGSKILEVSREKLSLGPLTLPHQLARVVLLEQLYRSWTILRGETYHY
ncbi:MAG: 23S rRNA (pseudouridine(1915)-N(3))-methyltransferase RlmH [Bdellovibrionota bacterium]